MTSALQVLGYFIVSAGAATGACDTVSAGACDAVSAGACEVPVIL